jgi:excisionase family DNA binding protein
MSCMLTVYDVAERLQVSPRTVFRLLADGRLKAHRIRRSVRVAEEDFQDFLSASARQSAAPMKAGPRRRR